MREDAFIVHGGKKLHGEVVLSGAKNVALKVLIAGLLFDQKLTFRNIPRLKDIHELLHLIEVLGATGRFVSKDVVEIDGRTLHTNEVDLLHGSKIRVSFLMFAPLLKKFGKAVIPNPGGCRLGARPIDRHIKLLEAFGVKVQYDSSTGFYDAVLGENGLQGAEFNFSKQSHTGTELALMLAVCAHGQSTIRNAALEPEIDDMINFLKESGAKIVRDGISIKVTPPEQLQNKTGEYTIMCDRLNAAAFGAFAIATKGDVLVKGLEGKYITDFTEKLIEAGGGYEEREDGLYFFYKQPLKATSIVTQPHPGFNTDCQGPWAILMTQAEGESIIHETVFENRFGYVQELNRLGAHIEFFQPEVENPHELYQFNIESQEELEGLTQGIKIHGPTQLHNGVLTATDIRAGASLVLAACLAEGESVIQGASIIDRGYDAIEETLSALGADIKRV